MNEWQPIEIAPKDGTRIILGWDSGEPTRYGFFTRNAEWKGWRAATLELSLPISPPTHWMPLPPPPDTGVV
jgi:hypothetical protein